jgi:hypothetical protein
VPQAVPETGLQYDHTCNETQARTQTGGGTAVPNSLKSNLKRNTDFDLTIVRNQSLQSADNQRIGILKCKIKTSKVFDEIKKTET